MGEEIFNLAVESVLFKDRDGMPGIGDDPAIGLRDICRDQDSMEDGDGVVVAANDQGGALDPVELIKCDMRLVKVKVEDLQGILIGCGFWFVRQIIVLLLHQIVYIWRQSCGIGPEIGAGKSHLFYLIGMADRKKNSIDAAIAPANDVAAVEVKGVAERIEVIDNLLEAQGISGVLRFAMGTGIDGDYVVMFGEVGDLVAHAANRAAVAVHQ